MCGVITAGFQITPPPITMMYRWVMLLAIESSAVHAWTAPQLSNVAHASFQLRARPCLQALADPPGGGMYNGADPNQRAATGDEIEKTDGIPNYMIRTSGTISRLFDDAVQDDGVVYEADRVVSLLTPDVIDMVQQQGGSAEKVDHLGENMMVDGMLFDDFQAEAIFDIASPDGDADVVTLKIVEARSSSEVELGQMGDDEAKKQSIASILGIQSGFSGWSAQVVTPGRVQAGFKITKRAS